MSHPIDTPRKRIGMLTPSSNTALEPITAAMLASLPAVTAHFGRFKVTEIALTQSALRQFDDSEILRAAELLAHAKVDVIAWNGTSASWLGFDRDERLIERIKDATGIEARTCVLGYRDVLKRVGISRIGLVSPYTPDVQTRIASVWGANGLTITAERHANISDNFSFAEISEAEIEHMIRAVVADGCDAVAILCTNMRGAGLVYRLEAELGVPIYDSVAVTLWACLDRLGVPMAALRLWGRMFG